MNDQTVVNVDGNLEMPLPFKKVEPYLPSNRESVRHRSINTLERLKSKKKDLEDSLAFMKKILNAGHVERVPLEDTPKPGKAWWLPAFPVRHPKKGKIRIVFDSSASYRGVSLNNELLSGPDQNTPLHTVLTRFREREVAFIADIEAMFHSFYLTPEHRNYLRFFWWDENNPEKPIVEFRARVHIFGNRPSPSVAIYGLRHAVARQGASESVKSFVSNSFYVDDSLGCADSVEEATAVLKEAKT
jgi:hypothetical protein